MAYAIDHAKCRVQHHGVRERHRLASWPAQNTNATFTYTAQHVLTKIYIQYNAPIG
jgi:hypothetical protein